MVEESLTQASVQALNQRWIDDKTSSSSLVSMHTDHYISNSVIMSNDYVSLLSCLSEDNGVANEAIVLEGVSSASWDIKIVKNQWGCTLLGVKLLLFCVKTVARGSLNFEQKIRRRRKTKHFGCLMTFWFSTFTMSFCTTRILVGHEQKHSKMNGTLS